jgi:hypothetical protein
MNDFASGLVFSAAVADDNKGRIGARNGRHRQIRQEIKPEETRPEFGPGRHGVNMIDEILKIKKRRISQFMKIMSEMKNMN